MKIKKTQITVETYEILVIKQGGSKRQICCAACGEIVQALKPEEAAAATGLQIDAIYRYAPPGDRG